MLGVFLYLTGASLRNRLWAQARRLANPRYTIALLAGVLYLWGVFFRPGASATRPAIFVGAGNGVPVTTAALALLVLYWWLAGSDRTALAFTPAEVQFFFPGPVSRRGLIHYKLLRAQISVLLSTLVWVYLARRGNPLLAPPLRALSLWTLFSTMHLHRLGASLVRESAAEHGAAGRRRNWVAIAVALGVVGMVAWGFSEVWPGRDASARQWGYAFRSAMAHGPASWALFPIRLVVLPGAASTAAAWLQAIGPALLIMALHYAWVVRTDATFEEAAVEASAHLAQRIADIRARRGGTLRPAPGGKRPVKPWFPLRPTGSPATAVIWKNVLAVTRSARRSTAVLILAAAGMIAAIVSASGAAASLPQLALFAAVVWVGATLLFGPQLARNDLRQDLAQLELIRTFPLSGARMVGAQLVSSTFVLAAAQLVPLTAAYLVNLADPESLGGPGPRLMLLLAAWGLLPLVDAMALAVHNGTALLFPGWVRLGRAGAATGIEATGQNVLTTAATLLTLGLLLIVPAGAATVVLILAGDPQRPLATAAAAATLVAAAICITELAAVVRWLGKVYERTEPGG